MIIEIPKVNEQEEQVGIIKLDVLDTLVKQYKSENYELVAIGYHARDHWLIELYDIPENTHVVVGLFEWLNNPKYDIEVGFKQFPVIEPNDLKDFIEAYYSPQHKSEARKMGDNTELALGHCILTSIAINTLCWDKESCPDPPVGEELMNIIDKQIKEEHIEQVKNNSKH